MKASSESGLCARVIGVTRTILVASTSALDSRVRGAGECRQREPHEKEILVVSGEEPSKIESPDGLRPIRRSGRMTYQSFGSDRLKATRPSEGAAKLAPRPKAVNQLSGGR